MKLTRFTRLTASITAPLAACLLMAACSSSSSTTPTSTTPTSTTHAAADTACSAAAPAGAAATSITSWTDPRPCSWQKTYPLFGPATTGDGSLAAAQTNGITVCAETDIPPIDSIDTSTSAVVGFEPDILHAAAKLLGIPSVTFVNTPFVSFIPALQAKKCTIVMGGIAITTARAQAPGIKYTEPYFVYADVVIVAKNSSITSPADLKGKTIAVVAGSTESVEAQQMAKRVGDVNVNEFTSAASTYQALLTNNAQAVIDLPVTLSQNPDRAKMRALPGLVPFTPTGQLANEYSTNPYTWGAGAAITSSSAGDLNRALSVAFATLLKKGTIKTILSKWDIYTPGILDIIRSTSS
jgi:ABC-type amino acid transport substrate-binding protein